MGRPLRNRLLRTAVIGLVSAAVAMATLELVSDDLRTSSRKSATTPRSGGVQDPARTPDGNNARGDTPAQPEPGPTPTPGSGAPGRPGPSSGALKPVLGGLLDRHHAPDQRFQGVVAGYVVTVPWATLQPRAAAPLPAHNPIDEAIATARARGLRLKLRVTGIDAPEWAKRLGGSPVPVSDYYGRKGTVGRFWTRRFGDAYAGLQRLLAARYDAAPEIVQTAVTRCTTIYAEPFLRQGRTAESVRGLLQAGYTAAADEICHREQVDAHQVWQRTRSGLSLNPYQRISLGGDVSPDEAFTERMIDYCRQALASRCVLENHSIRSTGQSRWYPKLYQAMRAAGVPIAFQTAAPARIGSLMDTLKWAIEQGASSVELPVSYPTELSLQALDPIDQRLQTTAQLAS